jgi:heme exporter protein B
MNYFKVVFAIVWKDLLIESRSKELILSILSFSILVMFIFSFGIETTPNMLITVGPAVLWISIIIGCTTGLTQSISSEAGENHLDLLLLAPASRDSIFFGKMLANLLIMLIIESVLLPLAIVILDIKFDLIYTTLVTVMATFGISLVGTLFATISANLRYKELVLPLIFIPIIIPTLLSVIGAFKSIALADFDNLQISISFLLVTDAIFVVICPLGFTQITQD